MATPTADPADVSSQKKRRLRIDQKFVLFPINNESLSRRVRLVKNGRVLRSFTASLGLPAQWWAHLDVSDWQGQTLTLSVEPDNSPPIAGPKFRAEVRTRQIMPSWSRLYGPAPRSGHPKRFTKSRCGPRFISRPGADGSTIPMGSCITLANITCSSSTTLMAFAGETCIGDMRSAPISFTGRNCRSRSIRAEMMIFRFPAAASSIMTILPAGEKTAGRRWSSPLPAPVAANASRIRRTMARPGRNSMAIPS